MSQDVHGIHTPPQLTRPYGWGYITSRQRACPPPACSSTESGIRSLAGAAGVLRGVRSREMAPGRCLQSPYPLSQTPQACLRVTPPSTAQLEHRALLLMAHTTAQYGRLDILVNLLGIPCDRSRASEVGRKQHRKNEGGVAQEEDQTNSPLDDDTPET